MLLPLLSGIQNHTDWSRGEITFQNKVTDLLQIGPDGDIFGDNMFIIT